MTRPELRRTPRMTRLTFLFLLPLVFIEKSLGDWFEIIWNAPSGNCLPRFNVSIPVKSYKIAVNKDQLFYGREIVIFYQGTLGLYPFVSSNGTTINGGIPQVTSKIVLL